MLSTLGDWLLLSGYVVAMFVSVYLYRIASEEAMLTKELGESYAEYRRRTHKLVPFLY